MGSKGVGICVIYAKRINRYVAVEGENVAEVLLLWPRVLRRVWYGDNTDDKVVAIPAMSSDFTFCLKDRDSTLRKEVTEARDYVKRENDISG